MRRWVRFLLLTGGCAAATVDPPPVESPAAAVVPVVRVDAPPPSPPDRDEDGLPDSEDRCPDRYGMGVDGCELPDSDYDAVIDRYDACVDMPETRNGFQDEDGCPDEIPKPLARALRSIPRPESTTDTLEHAKILSAAQKATLRRVAAALRAYPDVRIVIVGHQSDYGEIQYGKTPSGVAAQTAKRFVVEEEGIDADRIEWYDAGDTETIASVRTAAGRAKNRRLELKLIVEDPDRREVPPLLRK